MTIQFLVLYQLTNDRLQSTVRASENYNTIIKATFMKNLKYFY